MIFRLFLSSYSCFSNVSVKASQSSVGYQTAFQYFIKQSCSLLSPPLLVKYQAYYYLEFVLFPCLHFKQLNYLVIQTGNFGFDCLLTDLYSINFLRLFIPFILNNLCWDWIDFILIILLILHGCCYFWSHHDHLLQNPILSFCCLQFTSIVDFGFLARPELNATFPLLDYIKHLQSILCC